ncbi:hypothetical protein FKM82_017377 [Ascaphus truei]
MGPLLGWVLFWDGSTSTPPPPNHSFLSVHHPSEGLPFAHQDQLAAVLHVSPHPALQLLHLFPEGAGRPAQPAVLVLQLPHLVLQPGDALQLPLAALGGRQAVPQPLPLHLDDLLLLHVDGGQRGGRPLPAARGRVGDPLGLFLEGRRVGVTAVTLRQVVDGGGRRTVAARVVAGQAGVGRVAVGPAAAPRRRRGGPHAGQRHVGGPRMVQLVQVVQRLDEPVHETLLLLRHPASSGGRGVKVWPPARAADDARSAVDDQSFQLGGGHL